MSDVEKVARAIKELKPFEGGNENVEYILIRGLSAIGFQLPAAGAQDLAEAIAKAALAAMGERKTASRPLNTSAVVSHETANVSDKPVGWFRKMANGTWNHVSTEYGGAKWLTPLYASPRPEAVEEAVKAEREPVSAKQAEEAIAQYERIQMHALSLGESAKDAKVVAMQVVLDGADPRALNPDTLRYGNKRSKPKDHTHD